MCVSLHDVAPATVNECVETLAFLDSLLVGPVALLVVPDYHGLGRVDHDERFCEFLRMRAGRGDEIVLHGYCHRDRTPPGSGMRDWLERRDRTAGEGEFSRLDAGTARVRILRGLAVLRAAGCQPRGFVAPAWQMSPGTLVALETLPLQYCSTRDSVLLIGTDRLIAAPSLVASTRSLWRRALSPLWNQVRLTRRIRSPVVRTALHPSDMRYPAVQRLWRTLFRRLADRACVTEADLASTALPQPRQGDVGSSIRRSGRMTAR